MNYIKYSRQRDKKIIDLIIDGTALTRLQIQKIIFETHTKNKNSAKRKAQQRLSYLVKTEQIKKYHKDFYLPAIYYVNQKPLNMAHALAINDVYCAFIEQKNPEQIIEWEWSYRINDGMVIADAYINIFWDKDKKHRQVIWLEVERDPRKHFNKDIQYQKVWETDWNKTLPEWVVVENKEAIFPLILIVTDKKIEFKSDDLDYIIVTPEQVQTDIFSLIKED